VWAFGRMLKEPASAPCERLSIRRPIWVEELKKTFGKERDEPNPTILGDAAYLSLRALRPLSGLLA